MRYRSTVLFPLLALCSFSIGAATFAGCGSDPVAPDLGGGGPDGFVDAPPPDMAVTRDLHLGAPVLTSVTPASGPTTAQTSLVLIGMNFVDGATVMIGDQAATSVVVGSPTQLLAVAEPRPGKPGAVDVIVKNPDGQTAVLPKGFTYRLSSLSFAVPSVKFPTGGMGSWTALAVDLDKDGHLDVVTCNFSDDTISVLAGRADGSFAAPVVMKSGIKPIALAAGDVDGDGFVDVVSADFSSSEDGLYLNDGSGKLKARTAIAFPAMTGPIAVAVADVNGDGKADVVTAARLGPALLTSISAGAGMFAAPRSSPLSQMLPVSLLLAKFAPDTNLDAIVGYAQGANASLLVGMNGGGFSTEKTFPLGGTTHTGFAAADLNGDGLNDLVVAAVGGTQAQVLLGKPGGLSAPVAYDAGNGPYAVAIADVNLDGKLDLVTANAGSGDLAVLIGKGDGTFTAGPKVPTAQNAHWVFVADVDGDGLPDLLSVSRDTGSLEVFKNTIH